MPQDSVKLDALTPGTAIRGILHNERVALVVGVSRQEVSAR